MSFACSVTDQGMPDGRKMDADLVGPPRLQPAVEKRQVGRRGVQFLDDLVFRARRTTVGDDRHLQRISGIAADVTQIDGKPAA